MAAKKTTEQFREEIRALKFDLIGDYEGCGQQHDFVCKNCGNIIEATPTQIKNNFACFDCNDEAKLNALRVKLSKNYMEQQRLLDSISKLEEIIKNKNDIDYQDVLVNYLTNIDFKLNGQDVNVIDDQFVIDEKVVCRIEDIKNIEFLSNCIKIDLGSHIITIPTEGEEG